MNRASVRLPPLIPGKDVAVVADLVLPPMLNHHGTLFAGAGLQLLVKAAVLAATRRAGRGVVMASCHDVRFLHPVRVGEFVTASAMVRAVGRTSLEVWAEGRTEDPETGELHAALEGVFRLVCVDATGRPTPVS